MVIMSRAMALIGADVSMNEAMINMYLIRFEDFNEIYDYARDEVAYCIKEDIVHGKGDGTLDPQGILTRSEATELIRNFLLSPEFIDDRN